MRQRVMIAIALACEPSLLIADEPTTALDVTVQAQIIDLLLRAQRSAGTALLFITHDLGVVAEACTRVADDVCRRDGRGRRRSTQCWTRPRHPYTSGLLRSLPRLSPRGNRCCPRSPAACLRRRAMPDGCRFAPRCAHAEPACARAADAAPLADRQVRCWRSARARPARSAWHERDSTVPLLAAEDFAFIFPAAGAARRSGPSMA